MAFMDGLGVLDLRRHKIDKAMRPMIELRSMVGCRDGVGTGVWLVDEMREEAVKGGGGGGEGSGGGVGGLVVVVVVG